MTDSLPGDIFTVGQVLNNTYQIDRILGRGGTGEVYLASNQITGRQVAIKALNRAFSGNADYIELMKREEQIRAVMHPAVVRYTECSRSDDNHVFLVMDFVDGVPLSDEMARRQMDPRELLIVAHRVLEGLHATHAQGIIHRDLSPDNIILRDGDPAEAVIIDFGIAKDTAVGARTVVGSDFAGKYEYSSPEQFEGKVDARSDLYALGATLLAAFRGETPFSRSTPGEILRSKQHPLETSGVPEPLKSVVDRLAAPDPANRPQTARDMATEVGTLLKQKTGASPQPTSRKNRRSGLIPVFAVLALAALGLGGWATGLFEPAPPPLPQPPVYRLSLSFDPESPPLLNSHAPTEEDVALLRDTVTRVYGQAPGGEVTLAAGVPEEDWIPHAAALMGALAALDNGELEVTGLQARVTGLAIDVPTKAALIEELEKFEGESGWDVSSTVIAGPLTVSSSEIMGALAPITDCGPLSVSGDDDGSFGVGRDVRVMGDIAVDDTRNSIAEVLAPLIGERGLALDVRLLNPQLCEVRSALSDVPTNVASVALSDGATGERNLSGVFTTGQNPVVDLIVPTTLDEAYLWAFAINPDGSVINLVPNLYNEENHVSALGDVDGGLRRIGILHSFSDLRENRRQLAVRIQDGQYGKSEIVAILSREPLFGGRRPTLESVGAVSQAMRELMTERKDTLLGVTSSVVDARP